MAGFEKGNKWWEKRAKHGRDALFTDPQKLWDACVEYFKDTDSRNDWNESDWVGKDAMEVTRKRKTPYTLTGLCVYLGVSQNFLIEFEKTDTFKSDPDFLCILTRVRDIIRTQQVEGALTGHYNPGLTARLNNITDRQDITSGGQPMAPVVQVVSKQAADDMEKLKNM